MKKIFKNKMMRLVVVALLVAAGAISYGYIVATALNVGDTFSDSTKVALTWNTMVDTSAGVARLAAKTCDNDIWYCDQSNVIANDLGDGDFVLVARADISGTKQWKTTNTDCDRPQCGTDGAQDGDNLKADNTLSFSAYPARDACKSIGGRLPTITELSSIYTNRTLFGTFQSYYWSGTEYSDMYARNVLWSSGSVYYPSKTNGNYVRCVLGW